MNHKSLKYFHPERIKYKKKKWLELVKDYNYDIRYHLGKANIIVNSLSRNVTLSHIIAY